MAGGASDRNLYTKRPWAEIPKFRKSHCKYCKCFCAKGQVFQRPLAAFYPQGITCSTRNRYQQFSFWKNSLLGGNFQPFYRRDGRMPLTQEFWLRSTSLMTIADLLHWLWHYVLTPYSHETQAPCNIESDFQSPHEPRDQVPFSSGDWAINKSNPEHPE